MKRNEKKAAQKAKKKQERKAQEIQEMLSNDFYRILIRRYCALRLAGVIKQP